MFRWLESFIDPTDKVGCEPATTSITQFYWYFVRQVKWAVIALFISGLAVALLDVAIPIFMGRVVSLLASYRDAYSWDQIARQLVMMSLIFLIARPAAQLAQHLTTNQVIAPGMTNMIRWQNHWHVGRQSWSFFQRDFAGRIASRVIQTGSAIRESVVAGVNAIWYLAVYGTSVVALMSKADWRLTIPVVGWFVGYAILLRKFVPRLRENSRGFAEARSVLTGRVVDSYSNIQTVKLFARAGDEDAFVREALLLHTAAFHRQFRMTTIFMFGLSVVNAVLMVATGVLAVFLFRLGRIGVGTVATALPMAWQLSSMAASIAQSVTNIFENVGIVQDGMRSIALPREMPDLPGARELLITAGEIRFEGVQFDYGRARDTSVLRGIDLNVSAGERVGLVGPSGAGKSTLVHLLLRFYDSAKGRILIDGQDLALMSQESVRGQIAVVTQDTALLHRSIRDNIRFGRPGASPTMIEDAARRASAHEFIIDLEDWQGRRGYNAHIGERGVKLSGGQRQRIAIARAILKDAPIVVLDEATSALDSEVEASIQRELDELMKGRTVIVIAHRLSTIAGMDRLVVLDKGLIQEVGTHAELLAIDGIYSRLWRRQSGGFLATM